MFNLFACSSAASFNLASSCAAFSAASASASAASSSLLCSILFAAALFGAVLFGDLAAFFCSIMFNLFACSSAASFNLASSSAAVCNASSLTSSLKSKNRGCGSIRFGLLVLFVPPIYFFVLL